MKRFSLSLCVTLLMIAAVTIKALAGGIGVLSRTAILDFSSTGEVQYDEGLSGKITFTSAGLELAYDATEGTFVSQVITASLQFSDVGVHWKADSPLGTRIAIQVRTSRDGEEWTHWQKIYVISYPDQNSKGEFFGNLIGIDQRDRTHRYIQCKVMLLSEHNIASPTIKTLSFTFIDAGITPSTLLNQIKQETNIANSRSDYGSYPKPSVTSRAGWGCDESLMTWPPQYETVSHNIIHHTDTPNSDTDWPARVRSIYYYHAVTLGWGDIGYNYLVDPNGVLYEGRYGDDVIAAHALGYNDGTMGLAFLGSYGGGSYGGNTTPSSAMLSSAEELLAWKCDQRNIDPLGSGPDNDGAVYPYICGHRDIASTICPGNNLYNLLPTIRTNVDNLISGTPQESTLVRVLGTDPVYWLQNGKLYWVTTADVINLMSSLPGWGIDQIIDYPPDVFNPDNYPQGPRFITPNADSSNGLLIRQTGDTRVYVLDNGKRRWITSQEALNWKGTDWSADVIEVTSSIISNYIPIEGDSIYAIGEGESNQTIKNSFIDAYTRNENDPYCTSPSTWKGWPGTFSLCLGFPTGLVGDANISGYSGISGKYQRFDYTDNTYGAINWTNQYGAFEFHGAIGKKYQNLGYSGDLLGFPTSDEYQWGSYRRNDFECGYIYWVPPPVDCAYVVYCTFTISGYVRKPDNSPISGVEMSGLPGNPSTNSSGSYSGTVEYGWSGTVTPSKAGYTFSPSNRAYSNVTSDQSNQNYTGTLQTFTISGYVREADNSPISEVVMSGLPENPSTNSSGYYSGTVEYGWSGTVTPSKAGYTFSPANRSYSNVNSNYTDQNYTGMLQTFTISGYVRDPGGIGIAEVTMNGLPENPSTNSSGYYSGTVEYDWSGTVTPMKTEYTFSPSNRSYSNVTSDQFNQNYTGEGTNVSETQESKPYVFQLNQNYPNPFNPQTVIEYALPKDCQVQIAIYNLLGQKIRTLIDQYQTKGQKKIHWDGKDDEGNELAGGIYFYRLQAGDFSETKKMVLLR